MLIDTSNKYLTNDKLVTLEKCDWSLREIEKNHKLV